MIKKYTTIGLLYIGTHLTALSAQTFTEDYASYGVGNWEIGMTLEWDNPLGLTISTEPYEPWIPVTLVPGNPFLVLPGAPSPDPVFGSFDPWSGIGEIIISPVGDDGGMFGPITMPVIDPMPPIFPDDPNHIPGSGFDIGDFVVVPVGDDYGVAGPILDPLPPILPPIDPPIWDAESVNHFTFDAQTIPEPSSTMYALSAGLLLLLRRGR